MTLISRRARLYKQIRTAHLERARDLSPAAIVYNARRYDYDESLAEGLEVVQASPLRAALLLRRARLEVLEINEPLWTESLPSSALAVFAVNFARRGRPRIVTYAIGNADPFATSPDSFKRRVKLRLERMLARFVWKRIDAVAYGTDGARDVYHSVLPRRSGMQEALIPALPARSDVPTDDARGESVVFLGAFVVRKGLPLVLSAWGLVLAERPDAMLTLVGKGALLDDARRFADDEASVRLVVDPPRTQIRDILSRSRVLVLPSQPSPTWREQVGLPIVEGLEQGCAIVTTDETGLAPWLAAHGHAVVNGHADAEALARAIIGQIDAGDRGAAIVASLPPLDGRLAADAWMFDDAVATVEGTGHHG